MQISYLDISADNLLLASGFEGTSLILWNMQALATRLIMVLILVLFSLLAWELVDCVSVSMIPTTGTPPSPRDMPGFAIDEDAQKLYIYGGRNESPLDDMWEFDLKTESWREIYHTSSISPGYRYESYLFKKEPGKLLLFGGIGKRGPVSDIWEFDIENEYWKLVDDSGELPPRAYYRAMTHYEKDGKKYLAVYGGTGKGILHNSIHILDTESYNWTRYKNNGVPQPYTQASRIDYIDGSFYIWESVKNLNSNSPNLYKYDLESFTWSIIKISGPSPDYLQGHGQCVYNQSLYLIHGYYTYDLYHATKIYSLNLERNDKSWEVYESYAREFRSAAFGYICSKNYVYMFGGYSYEGLINQLMKFDFTSNEQAVTNLSDAMAVPTARQGHAMEVYNDKLYILGGKDKDGKELIDIYTYDIKTKVWSPLIFKSTDSPSPRSEFAHIRMGEILIIFGGTSNSNLLGDMHYFNLRTSEWKAVEPKSNERPTSRKGSCMAAVGDSIFIFGGITINGYSDELWRFDSGLSTYTLLKPSGDAPKSAKGGCRAYFEGEDTIFETYLGETTGKLSLSSIYKYKLSTNSWSGIQLKKPDSNLLPAGVSLYLKDKLLVAGGGTWKYLVFDEIYVYESRTHSTRKLDQKLPHNVYNAASVYYKNKLYIHGGVASFQNLPLPDIPLNYLIIIDLDVDCSINLELCTDKCSPGTYYNNNECLPCPLGSYQDSVGGTECKKCPQGFYSNTKGADSYLFCKPCPQGTFNTDEGEAICYDCPRGSKCSLNHVESEELDSNTQIKLSDQPDLYETKEDEVESYNFISYLVIAPLTLLLLFIMFFFRNCSAVKKANLYASQNNLDLDTSSAARKTTIGGIASSIFFGITSMLIVNMSITYGLDNITESKALVPLVSLEEEYGSVTSI